MPDCSQVPALRVVDACGNQIKRVGAVALAKAALTRPQLELLALDENMVSEAGLDEVRAWSIAWGLAGSWGSNLRSAAPHEQSLIQIRLQ